MENKITTSFLLRQHRRDKPIEVLIDTNGLEDAVQGKIAFQDVLELRLDRIVATKYNEGHYLCRIKTANGSFYIRADFGDELECSRFRDCMYFLHEALAAANPKVIYGSGVASKTTFYLLNIGFILTFAILEVAVVFGVMKKENYAIGALVLIGIPVLAFFLLRWANNVTRPITYQPNDIPAHLLPAASAGEIKGLDAIRDVNP